MSQSKKLKFESLLYGFKGGSIRKKSRSGSFFCKELWFGHSRNLAWTVMYVYLAIYEHLLKRNFMLILVNALLEKWT